MKHRFFPLLGLLAFLLSACQPVQAPAELILATTTSTQDSGLLDAILPVFEADAQASVRSSLSARARRCSSAPTATPTSSLSTHGRARRPFWKQATAFAVKR